MVHLTLEPLFSANVELYLPMASTFVWDNAVSSGDDGSQVQTSVDDTVITNY
eukprot:m.1666262 g.1666262  ORF g.1666262 m.1666262 type:complete len:52 (+) comp144339_c0_seq1:47-202(+)